MISSIDVTANDSVRQAIQAQIVAGQEIGMQVAAYLDGQLVIDTWAGLADPATERLVDGDTLFNVFSVTKAVAATAVHLQSERDLLDYDAPIAHYWPEFGVNGKGNATVRHALTHRAGLPQMPEGVTPELMCDWDWMCAQIAAMTPLAAPGTRTLYQSMTFGWILGELVRRTDPGQRSLGRFIKEEIAAPLQIPDLWVGVPDEVVPRIAKLTNASTAIPAEYLPALYSASMPPQVDLIPEVFERADVRRAEVAGVGGIFSARSCARFWAMLAQGGALDGVRLLSADRVATFNVPRANAAEPDPVMFGYPIPISNAGFWLGGGFPSVAQAISPQAIFHPGAGNSVGWADLDKKLAVAICHNRMFNSPTPEQDTVLPIARAVNQALGF